MTAVDDLIMMINERAEALRREKSAHPHGAVFALAEFFVYTSFSARPYPVVGSRGHSYRYSYMLSRIEYHVRTAVRVRYRTRIAARSAYKRGRPDVSPDGPVGSVDSS